MAIATFDGATSAIQLNNGVTAFDVVNLYSNWKDWSASNMQYPPAFRYVGGDPLVGGQALGITYFLTNGWRIRPQQANHMLTVTGDLFTDEGDTPFLPIDGCYSATIIQKVSSLSTVSYVNTSGPAAPTTSEITSAIMNADLSQYRSTTGLGGFLYNKVLTVAKYLALS